jgi:hypothetical protein
MYLYSTKEEATHVLMRANSGCGCSVFRNANPTVGEEGLLYFSELRLTLTSLSLEADTKVNKKLLPTSAEAPIDICLSIIYYSKPECAVNLFGTLKCPKH